MNDKKYYQQKLIVEEGNNVYNELRILHELNSNMSSRYIPVIEGI